MAETRIVNISANSARNALASDVVVAGDLAFVSGVRPVDLNNDRTPLPEKVEAQVDKVFANLDVMLQAAGLARGNIVSVRVYLIDFERLFDRMNNAYLRHMGAGALPARTCVGVSKLTRGAQVEMEFVVRVGVTVSLLTQHTAA